jgi:hypothetical protein
VSGIGRVTMVIHAVTSQISLGFTGCRPRRLGMNADSRGSSPSRPGQMSSLWVIALVRALPTAVAPFPDRAVAAPVCTLVSREHEGNHAATVHN